MSRLYEMNLVVKGFDKSKSDAIIEAAKKEWPFDDLKMTEYEQGPMINGCAQSNLCGGETEEEFSERLARAVFKANGKPCHVHIEATYLEELPHEDYDFNEENPPEEEDQEDHLDSPETES